MKIKTTKASLWPLGVEKLVLSLAILAFYPNLLAQTAAQQELSGKWLLELNSQDVGLVRTVMTFEASDTSFTAFTRENADRMILGRWKSTVARILTNSFENGSLLRVVKGIHRTEGDTIRMAGILTSAMGNYYFNTKVIDGEMTGKLTNGKGEKRGTIKAVRSAISLPLEDYSEVYKEAEAMTRDKIYDPKILEGKEWRKFDKKMESVSDKVQDDLELVFAFFYHSRKLPFSHFAMMKRPAQDTSEKKGTNEPQALAEKLTPSTCYLRIKSFAGTAREMDSVMSFIIQQRYENLIVDLRDNGGGSVAAGMSFATSVVDSAFFGGVFLTQKWFNKQQEPPSVEEYHQLPHFTEANFDLIIEGIHKEEGLCLKVIPKEETFSGNLFVLTNRNTASTCEPIAYGLQQHGRAKLVGETTAGAMLNGEIFELDSGFSLVVPTATYYTSDGFMIDQNGVKPDVATSSDEALEYVINNLISD